MQWSLDETALDLFARHAPRRFRTGVRFLDAPVPGGYRPRQVVELCGPPGSSLAATLLAHVMAEFLLNDSSARVFLFDHECEIDSDRLVDVLAAKIQSKQIADAVKSAEEQALEMVARVAVCHCRDTFQWLATLNQVHFQLLNEAPAPLMLVFNCVGSFCAMDKMTARDVGDGLALSEQIFVYLKQFIRHHSPIVFAAKEIREPRRMAWEHHEYMPSHWTSQVSKRIFVRPVSHPNRPQTHDASPSELSRSGDVTEFEAKCVVDGQGQVFSAQIHGSSITCAASGTKVAAQNRRA